MAPKKDETTELEELMKEFPDWKEKCPEIYETINPPRYHKNRKDRTDPHLMKKQHARVVQKRSVTVPKSDYQATYDRKHGRPRSTKRPPPSPRDPSPPPGDFVTVQKKDYIPKDMNARPGLIVREDNYEPPNAPFDARTSYNVNYTGQQALPSLQIRPQSRHKLRESGAKFDSRTTNKDHYKRWVQQPTMTFGELPSFTGSILYPERTRVPETTAMSSYKAIDGKPADLIRQADGNIKLEGDLYMDTTSGSTYKTFNGAQPARRVTHKPQIVVRKRGKFNDETQFKRDFYYKGGHKPPRAVDPAPVTIHLRFNEERHFDTEQKKEYKGIDTAKHTASKPIRGDLGQYEPPTGPFDGTTHQKRDYQPIDLKEAYQPPSKMPVTKKAEVLPKLDDMTMNKHFFKKWEVSPRPRYGDFHEGHTYVPPSSKFDGESTTHKAFVAMKADIPDSCKPAQKPMEQIGSHDFNTMYKITYNEPNNASILPEEQKLFLLKELRKRKREKEQEENRLTGNVKRPVQAN